MARIFEFGTAPQATKEGYKLVHEVDGTPAQLLAENADKDIVFVQSAAIHGRPGVFRFGRFERDSATADNGPKARTLNAEAARIVALNSELNLTPITTEDAKHVARVARQLARARSARNASST